MTRAFLLLGLALGLATPATRAAAQDAKQILSITKDSWIAVREYNGQDLLYFTNLLAWRCGVERIRYSVNDGDMKPLKHEPCHKDEAAPNALYSDEIQPYLTYPLGSINTIAVEVRYPDGSEDLGTYARASVMIR